MFLDVKISSLVWFDCMSMVTIRRGNIIELLKLSGILSALEILILNRTQGP